MARVFEVREKKVDIIDGEYVIRKVLKHKNSFSIPVNQVLSCDKIFKKNPNRKHIKETWLRITVTNFIWDHCNLSEEMSRMRKAGEAFFRGEEHFDVNWDYVISRQTIKGSCFFCGEATVPVVGNKGNPKKETKDHLIPRAILKCYGLTDIPNNLVHCCIECNAMKANLHPSMFRKLVTLTLHTTGQERYRTILDVLNETLTEKGKDI